MAIAGKVIQAEIDGAKHKSVIDDVLSSYEKAQA